MKSGCSGFLLFALVVSLTVGTLFLINHPSQQKSGAILPGPVPTLAPGTPPPTTQSIYEFTTDAQMMHKQGCQEDIVAPYGLIILDWGAPRYIGGGEYGAGYWIPQGGSGVASDSEIRDAVEAFIQGVWDCRQPTTNFAIGIGVSNNGSCWYCPNPDDPNETQSGWYHAGAGWGQMVNQVQQFVTSKGMGGQIVADAADDMEVEWATFAETKAFVDGYNAVTKQLLFDFGDDSGGTNPSPWTVDQVWYVAYGAADDLPLPEIYGYDYGSIGQATGWEQVSQWACANKKGPMRIIGTMDEAPESPSLPIGDSWKLMYHDIASATCTSPMASSLILSTNINFIGEMCPGYPNNQKPCPWTGA